MFTPNDFGQMIFDMKYAAPGEKIWQQRCKVVADHISSCENEENRPKIRDRFYKVQSDGDLVPGGRILFGSGRARYNLLNCYVIVPEDSVASIGKTIQDMYKISCAGGGIGFNFSKIRPKGDDIQNIKHSAPGSVSVMKMINEIGNHVRAGKNRRTALMGILDVTHPDILEFLHVKLDLNQLENFNISVGITDRFIEACENGEDWHFTFHNKKYYIFVGDRISPKLDENGVDTGEKITSKVRVVATSAEDALERAKQHYLNDFRDQFENFELRPLKAMELFAQIWDNAVKSGDPGIFNVSKANSYTNVGYFEEMNATNPCGEIPLPSYGNCCLGHVNLANMVDENGEFNWKRFAAAVRAGIRFLDNVLDVNTYPVQETREVAHKSRRIGLGVLGYHYMLIKLGIKYGSERCLEFTERLAQTFRDEAYKTSVYIAKEKGPFAAFDAKKFLNEGFAKTLPARIRFLIKKYGIRNAVMLTSAPTGTTSIVLGVSSGIEPIFAPMYFRRFRKANTWAQEVVLDPLFKEYLEAKKPLEHFVGAYDVTPEEHMAVQAVWQRYLDSAISKTINLPEDAKAVDLVSDALNYMPELKGLTIYRAGSKGNEPLAAIPTTAENIRKYGFAADTSENASAEVCKIGGDCG